MIYLIGFFYIILVFTIFAIISIPFRKYLPKWYTCSLFGWHGDVEITNFDGLTTHGICKKCKTEVMRDSQGNWF